MMNYQLFFTQKIDKIKLENRYRNFIELIRDAENFPYAFYTPTNSQIILWCINDYLGMSRNPLVIEAAIKALSDMGVGSGGTRNICGSHRLINELEDLLAKLHNKEKALVFTSGYVSNDSTLTALAQIIPGVIYFSDEANHASIIQGIKRSGAVKYIYKHNDIDSLRNLLTSVDINIPKIIVFESVYSMNGAISPMIEICSLAKEFRCLTYLDEVHSVGLYGERAGGLAQELGCENQIDILQGTLAKGFGTIGGYIAANHYIIDAVKSIASGFIFTTSLPPSIVAASIASIKILMSSNTQRDIHKQVVKKTKNALAKNGIDFIKNDSHIISIIVGDPIITQKISSMLLHQYKIYIQHINFPTVPKGSERLRITPTPFHTSAMIDQLAGALKTIFKELGVKLEKKLINS
jgi:5-aminolevulinate synthase